MQAGHAAACRCCLSQPATQHLSCPASPPAPPHSQSGAPPLQRGRVMSQFCQPNRTPDGQETAWGTIDPQDLFGPQGWCMAAEPKIQCPCSADGGRLLGGWAVSLSCPCIAACGRAELGVSPKRQWARAICEHRLANRPAGWGGKNCEEPYEQVGRPGRVFSQTSIVHVQGKGALARGDKGQACMGCHACTGTRRSALLHNPTACAIAQHPHAFHYCAASPQFCFNQCNGRGTCIQGYCRCHKGVWGAVGAVRGRGRCCLCEQLWPPAKLALNGCCASQPHAMPLRNTARLRLPAARRSQWLAHTLCNGRRAQHLLHALPRGVAPISRFHAVHAATLSTPCRLARHRLRAPQRGGGARGACPAATLGGGAHPHASRGWLPSQCHPQAAADLRVSVELHLQLVAGFVTAAAARNTVCGWGQGWQRREA